jgi:protein SCO1/2
MKAEQQTGKPPVTKASWRGLVRAIPQDLADDAAELQRVALGMARHQFQWVLQRAARACPGPAQATRLRPMNPQRRAEAPSITGTLIACSVVLTLFVVALHALTGGFELWTFEDMRRARAMQGRIQAHPLQVRTAQGPLAVFGPPAAEGGAVTLVDFIYTSCPTVCQALGSEYAQMQQALAARGPTAGSRIKLLSLSFDMAHDGPAQLDAYARLHHADSRLWTVAVPARRADAERLLHELGVVVVRDGWGGYVHNGTIHVIDGAGKVLAIYDDADWSDALALARRLVEPVR